MTECWYCGYEIQPIEDEETGYKSLPADCPGCGAGTWDMSSPTKNPINGDPLE